MTSSSAKLIASLMLGCAALGACRLRRQQAGGTRRARGRNAPGRRTGRSPDARSGPGRWRRLRLLHARCRNPCSGRQDDPHGTADGRHVAAIRCFGVPHSLFLGERPRRQEGTHRRLRLGFPAERHGARRRLAADRLGARHGRHRRRLRPVEPRALRTRQQVSQPLAGSGLCRRRVRLSGPRHARRPSLSRDPARSLLRPRRHPRCAGRSHLQHRQARRPRRPEPGRRRCLRHSRGGGDLRPRDRHSRHRRHRHTLLHQRHRARRPRSQCRLRRPRLLDVHHVPRRAGRSAVQDRGLRLRSQREPSSNRRAPSA